MQQTANHIVFDEISLRTLITILFRRKVTIILITLLFAGLAFAFINTQTPKYKSTAVLQFTSASQNIVDIESVLAGLPQDDASLKSELDVIGSRDLLRRVYKKHDLGRFPELALPPNDPTLSFGEQQDINNSLIAGMLSGRLDVFQVPKSKTVKVSFESTSAKLSKIVADAVIDEYLTFQVEQKYMANSSANQWLNERLEGLKQKVAESERAEQEFREANNLVVVGGETVMDQQLIDLNAQLTVARSSRAQSEAKLEQIRNILDRNEGLKELESIPDVIGSDLINSLKVKETTVLQARSDLGTRYGHKHPKMVKINQELRDIQDKIASEISNIIKGVENQLAVATREEENLMTALGSLNKETNLTKKAEVELAELMREKETNIALYEAFLSRYKETSESPEHNLRDARVVSYADVPLAPFWPNKPLILAAAVILGAGLGLILAFAMEYLDKGFRNLTQLEQTTGTKALGMYPDTYTDLRITDLILEKPNSIFAESLRSILTATLRATPDQTPKVVMITSSLPKEGKSVFSASIARLTALSGKKVLLIDCDMRLPSTHKLIPSQKELGLSDFLTGKSDLKGVLDVDTKSGLHFIRSRANTPYAMELLDSARMRELIQVVRSRYDLVILDAPPVLAVADPITISLLADTSILLSRWEATPRTVTIKAVKQFTQSSSNLAGVVMSRVNLDRFEKYNYDDSGVSYKQYSQYYTN